MKDHEICLLSKQNVSWHLLSSSKIAEIGSSIFDGVAFVSETFWRLLLVNLFKNLVLSNEKYIDA